MVRKIKFIVLILFAFILCFLSFCKKGNIEVNLLKTLLPKNAINSDEIISTANKSSSMVKVVFEAQNQKELNDLVEIFLNKIDKDFFEFNKPDVSKLVNKYLSEPNNFLSDKTKKLLKNKEFDTIYSNSMNMLYSPASIQLSNMDKDPYLLFDDFIMSNRKISSIKNIDNKFYDSMTLKIKNSDGLSPDICNKKIKELTKIQKELSNGSNKIYLAGTPVHSFYTSIRSVVSINVICILSTLIIIFLTYFYFRSLKLLIPVAISLTYGMLTGFCATRLIFNDFQIITMVFSATLIGIGIDYSYHYFFKGKIDKNFIVNLTCSFLTSTIPFVFLYLTNIELLEQIAVFTIFGLFGIYIAVLIIYPEFDIKMPEKTIKLDRKYFKISLILILILSVSGFFRLHFNDSLTTLYNPSKKLKTAEVLYNNVSGNTDKNAKIIIVEAKNKDGAIEKEEEIVKLLEQDNIKTISLSKFMPSKKIQEENFNLVKDLYNSNLDKFSDILTLKQINSLKAKKFNGVEFNLDDCSIFKDFITEDNSFMIFAFTDKIINLSDNNIKIIDFQSDIMQSIKHYRKILMPLFPLVILILAIILTILCGYKKAIKMVLPSIVGVFCAIGVSLLILGEINLFSIISMFLLVGFTMDYSIFRANGKNCEDSILISCLTTSFSFLLLCFCGFKLLSSISLILFIGIITSYTTGWLLFSKQRE